MPAEIQNLSYVNNANLLKTGAPWHGLGEAHDDWLTDSQAKKAIGFEVETRPLYRKNDAGIFVAVDDAQETVRIDDDSHIATVGSLYVPFNGGELIDLGSELVDDWGAKWDTAGTLRFNRLIFAALRLDVVSGEGRGLWLPSDDPFQHYTWLVLSSAHDGSRGVTGAVVNVRPVCRNTFLAGDLRAKASWSVKHIGNVGAAAREAHRTIDLVTKRQKEWSEWEQRLAEVDFQVADFDKLTAVLYPTKKEESNGSEEALGAIATRNAESRREGAKANWLTSLTIPDDLRFTKWGALQAVSEYTEHKQEYRWSDKRSAAPERRMLNTVMGGPAQIVRTKAQRYLATV